MFNKSYEDRLAGWREFRDELETAIDPIQLCIDYSRIFYSYTILCPRRHG